LVENIRVAIIISKLQLFQIKRELFLGDAMMLDQSLLGPTPEPLQSVDGDLTGREALFMVHFQMPVSAEHQAVVTPELVSINDASPANLLDGET
jgi:hypothetical protein